MARQLVHRFGRFEVDLERRILRRDGRPVRVQDHPLTVLAALLEEPGEEVSREHLRQCLWPNRPFVDSEAGINTAVRKLREALGDDADNPRFIETRPRHGYRFIAPVEIIETGIPDDVPAEGEARAVPSPGRPRATRWRALAALTSLAVAAGLLLLLHAARSRRPAEALAAPAGQMLAGSFALSPQSDQIVAVVTDPANGESRLWLGSTSRPGLRALPRTEGAALPFWAPDGSELAFFAAGQLVRFDLASQSAQPIAVAPNGRGGAWARDGTILFAPDINTPIFRVAAGGGPPEQVTELGDVPSHRFPLALPDGRGFVYLALREDRAGSELRWGEIDRRSGGTVAAAVSSAAYVEPGWLLFSRGSSLLAQRFDVASRQVSGAVLVVAEKVSVVSEEGPTGLATFSAAPNGTLAWTTLREAPRRLRWRDRQGRDLGAVGPPGQYAALDLDAANRRVALLRYDRRATTGDLVLLDLEAGTVSQLTDDAWPDSEPRLSPDGTEIAFLSLRRGSWRAYVRPVDRGGDERELTGEGWRHLHGWFPDGRALVAERRSADTGADLWTLPVGVGSSPTPLIESEGDQSEAALSPDGRWLAWVDRAPGGESRLAVQRLDQDGAARAIVSAGPAEAPRWASDGRQLFFVAQHAVRTIPFETDGPRAGGAESAAFEVPQLRLGSLSDFAHAYAIDRSGERILVIAEEAPEPPPLIRLVGDWRRQVRSLGTLR